MNLSVAIFFCVNYPNRRGNAECKQLLWVGATSLGSLVSAAGSFSKNCSEPCRTSAAKAMAHLSHAARCGEPGSQAARFD